MDNPTLEQKQLMTKILSEGTYGCALYPGVTCENKQTPNYITKIQIDSPVVQNEITIGQTLIEKYGNKHQLFFAPIIKTCNVQSGEIENDEIQKCKIMQTEQSDTTKSFVNSKIRYIGKNTLNRIFKQTTNPTAVSSTTPPPTDKLIDIYLYLLKSMQMLLDANIVHMDIKDNNIMYDTHHYVPIIIDFGLSRKMPLTFQQSAQYFQKYEIYISWPIEVFILSQICQNSSSEIITEQTADIIITICMTNIDNPNGIYQYQNFFQPNEIETFKTDVQTFIKENIGFTYESLHDKLMESYPTWDMYGLSATYLFLLKTFNPPLPENYINVLKGHILTSPTKRETIQETIPKIHQSHQSNI